MDIIHTYLTENLQILKLGAKNIPFASKKSAECFQKNFLKSISFLTAIKIQILLNVQAQLLSGVAILNRRCGNVDVEIQRMKIFSQPPPPLLSMGTITQSSGGEPSLNVTFIFIPLLP